jgi:hypothetical protein
LGIRNNLREKIEKDVWKYPPTPSHLTLKAGDIHDNSMIQWRIKEKKSVSPNLVER